LSGVEELVFLCEAEVGFLQIIPFLGASCGGGRRDLGGGEFLEGSEEACGFELAGEESGGAHAGRLGVV
jgi:hypothetical protein